MQEMCYAFCILQSAAICDASSVTKIMSLSNYRSLYRFQSYFILDSSFHNYNFKNTQKHEIRLKSVNRTLVWNRRDFHYRASQMTAICKMHNAFYRAQLFVILHNKNHVVFKLPFFVPISIIFHFNFFIL